MRTTHARTLVEALKTGSSMPLVVEDDAGARWLVKTRGAGAGTRALVCEALYGVLADAIDVPVPRRVIVTIDEDLLPDGDPEIVALVRASVGTNLGFQWVDGARPFSVARPVKVDPDIAARVLALDTMLLNVDRTSKNPNLLVEAEATKRERLWFVDHASLLLFEHDAGDAALGDGGAIVRQHLFADRAARFEPEALRLVVLMLDALIDGALAAVPSDWLADDERTTFRALLRSRRDRWQEWRASVRAVLA